MEEHRIGTNGARVFLQPIAAPSILGLFGFAAATLIVAANLAGWYGTDRSAQIYVIPFAAFFGGLAQFLAGMWCYRARDGLGTAMHGMWGAFWMGYGTLVLLASIPALSSTIAVPATGKFVPLGYWFLPLAIITWIGAAAALRVNVALTVVLFLLGLGAAFEIPGFFLGREWIIKAGGYSLILSAVAAIYTATGLLTHPLYGREIPPLGSLARKPAVAEGVGEPGVMVGQ
jgi:succinate-acetate transporter protein